MNRNGRVALSLCAFAGGMLLLAYASVPLYRLFCQQTGYGGTTQRAAATPAQTHGRLIHVRFDAQTDPRLPWEFAPGEPEVAVRIGQNKLTFYTAHNLSDKTVTGHAVYNVVPHAAGAYFDKIECFCFTDQTLKAGERVRMPVSFFIDPAIEQNPDLQGVQTITLSYTFFPATSSGKKDDPIIR